MIEDQPVEGPTGAPDRARSRRNLAWLLTAGALMAAGGLICGLAAKAFADHASLVASSARTLVCAPSSSVVCPLVPAGAHYVAPDYTGLWIGIVVAVFGAIVLLTGIIVASTKPRGA
jgi:hypothetical protein